MQHVSVANKKRLVQGFKMRWRTVAARYICILPQASSHQIQAARFSSQYETSGSGVQNAVAHCRRATKNVECANVFSPFIFHALWILYGKAYMCALLKIVARY